MGVTHVTATVRNIANRDRSWEGLFLVDTGATDSLVLIATHDYSILKELELLMRADDSVRFCTLYRDKSDGELACETAGHPFELGHSPIAEAFTSLYDRAVERSLGRSVRR